MELLKSPLLYLSYQQSAKQVVSLYIALGGGLKADCRLLFTSFIPFSLGGVIWVRVQKHYLTQRDESFPAV